MVKVVHCAVYTRKSSEEGLEQAFNSLNAQREACEAYIKSQGGEGWQTLVDEYDDGGFSGGTMDRPALGRLLERIRAGQVNVVVVYKVDRLSRSLSDFVRMVELFEQHQVSFVSVTQHFNTATSIGRLTLNVLLSFAQFEREVTGERIRDKVAASKKKGLWMGGNVPLGYDVVDKALVINAKEAEVVRFIFEEYHRMGSVRVLKACLDTKKVTSKCRLSRQGNRFGGKPLSRGAVYTLLKNPLYIGKVRHKNAHYPAPHTPIVDEQLWSRVQTLLLSHRQSRQLRSTTKDPSLLTGLIWDDRGHLMSPTFTTKQKRRYRYYVSQAVLQYQDKDAGSVVRVPAQEIEAPVLTQLEQLFSSPNRLLDILSEPLTSRQISSLDNTAKEICRTLSATPPHPKIVILKQLIHRILLSDKTLTMGIKRSGLRRLLGITDNNESALPAGDGEKDIVELSLPFSLKRTGREIKMVLVDKHTPDSPGHPMMVQALQQALRKALIWNESVLTGKKSSLAEIAKEEQVTQRYIAQMIRLAYLAPDIQEAIFAGRVPPEWRVNHFRVAIPLDWTQQKKRFPLHRI